MKLRVATADLCLMALLYIYIFYFFSFGGGGGGWQKPVTDPGYIKGVKYVLSLFRDL